MTISLSPSPASETLEDYLAGDHHRDMADIRELEGMIRRAANVFLYAQADDGTWAYDVSREEKLVVPENPKLSHGTQGMIAAVLSKITGESHISALKLAGLKPEFRQHLGAALDEGLKRLEQDVDHKKALISGSFGRNDPITVSHASELRGGQGRDDLCTRASKILSSASEAITKLVSFDPNGDGSLLPTLPLYYTKPSDGPDAGGGHKDKAEAKVTESPKYLRNAFVPLRIARIVAESNAYKKTLSSSTDVQDQAREGVFEVPQSFAANYRQFFESTLHEQLSYSDIPDSRFDPAELIFCLEGLLIVSRRSVDERLMARVLDVLEARQDESAHWRPNRPLYATPQGMTMLPISVEGAVSLMRSIAAFDGDSDFQVFSRRAVGMLRRFWQWLLARSVAFDLGPKVVTAQTLLAKAAGDGSQPAPGQGNYHKLLGWHSEHVNNPGLIQLWDTSQVVEFMLAYRALLQRAVAGRTLQLSGLKVNRSAGRRPDKPLDKWDEIVGKFEPRHGADEKDQVYRKIKTAFIEPWAENRENKASSILLYGPPGTGKSTVGENIADALGMRMITVTVSDFLGRGGAYVEARAKAIFETLEAQFDTVILFDEIDAFLLDRDSARYEKQDTLFQFLTPGMLTKINDLHKLARSIFIIATNYKDRIDPAIQRKGRIDQHYLLGLPDKKRREAILRNEMKLEKQDTVSDDLVKDTVFYGYSDIKAAVAEARGNGAIQDAVAEKLDEPERRPTTVASYLKRLTQGEAGKPAWSDFPTGEFSGLFELWKEVRGDADIEDLFKKVIKGDADLEDVKVLTKKLEGKQDA